MRIFKNLIDSPLLNNPLSSNQGFVSQSALVDLGHLSRHAASLSYQTGIWKNIIPWISPGF